MADQQFVVSVDQGSLNMRRAGSYSTTIVASLRQRAIVHVTGEANAANFAPGYVFGWLGADGKTLYADSFTREESSVDAVIFDLSQFTPQGEPDAFGRQSGKVSGWVYLPYLTDAYKAYLEGKK